MAMLYGEKPRKGCQEYHVWRWMKEDREKDLRKLG